MEIFMKLRVEEHDASLKMESKVESMAMWSPAYRFVRDSDVRLANSNDDDNITRLRPWTFEGRGNTSYHTFGGAFGDRHGSYWYRLYLEIIHDCARCLGYHCPRRFKYDLGNFRVRSGLIDIQENINITNQGKPIIGGYDV
ncbi:hypothetical protein B9Z55_025764 [Caenorhabditis nigoni]|uniref:Uncharacterized protein n=1 Tax=Caenorhabditis nigoni TaxID=1611254 RepID=A0A2G5T045_9PELO|nr:hypothetical protein B9Z55_025764 [Caenorhabditis nigoni]